MNMLFVLQTTMLSKTSFITYDLFTVDLLFITLTDLFCRHWFSHCITIVTLPLLPSSGISFLFIQTIFITKPTIESNPLNSPKDPWFLCRFIYFESHILARSSSLFCRLFSWTLPSYPSNYTNQTPSLTTTHHNPPKS